MANNTEDVKLTRTKIARVMLLKEYEHLSVDEMVATDTMYDIIQQEANRQKLELLDELASNRKEMYTPALRVDAVPLSAIEQARKEAL